MRLGSQNCQLVANMEKKATRETAVAVCRSPAPASAVVVALGVQGSGSCIAHSSYSSSFPATPSCTAPVVQHPRKLLMVFKVLLQSLGQAVAAFGIHEEKTSSTGSRSPWIPLATRIGQNLF